MKEETAQSSVKSHEEKTSPLATANPNITPEMRITTFEVMFEIACKHANGELQRIHGLELAKTSKSEAHACMQLVHFEVESMNRIDQIDPWFAEMACTSLFIFWKDYQLVHNTLCNIKRMAKIASDEVKDELIERRVVLAASLSVCFQGLKKNQDFVKLLDENIELVILIYYHVLHRGPYPVNFHRLLFTSFMMIVPFILNSVKRNKPLMEGFVWILKELFVALHKNFGESHITMTKEWLEKYGIIDYAFSYLRDHQLGISKPKDQTLMQLLCITGYLIKNVKPRTLISIVPKLVEFLNVDKINSLKAPLSVIEVSKPYRVAALCLDKILQEVPNSKVTERLLKFDFIGTIQNAVNCYPEIHSYVPGLLISFLEKIKSEDQEIATESSSSKNLTGSQLCSLVVDSCNLAKPFLIKSNSLSCAYAKVVSTACLHFNIQCGDFKLNSLTNGSFDMMVSAYTVLCYSQQDKDDDRSTQWSLGTYILSFISYFEDKKTPLIQIPKGLLETLSYYSREQHTTIDPQYRRLVILLLTHSFDDISDFASDRWKNIHYLMALHYAENIVEMPLENLSLLWKLIRFDMIEEVFIPTLKLAEIELQKIETVDVRVLKAIKDLILTGSKESCFKLIITQLRSLMILKENDEQSMSVQKLYRTTRLLHNMALNNNERYQLEMLKGLVFACLDVVRDLKDIKIEENVNMFVVHLFLNNDDQEANTTN